MRLPPLTSSGRRPGGGCCQPDYLVSFPGKPDPHCPCRYPERFFRRALIFSPGVSGGHSRLSRGGPFHRPGVAGAFLTGRGSYGSRLPALISGPSGGCSDRRAAALRCGALRSFINGVLPATGSWPISTRRYSRDGRPWFVDCGGSHRAVPQSRAHGRPKRGGSISAGRRTDSSSVGKRTLKTGTRSYRIDFLSLRKLLSCDWPCRLPRRGFAFPGQANAWRLSVNSRRTPESSRDLFRDSSPPN
jgi:hypothetical protein